MNTIPRSNLPLYVLLGLVVLSTLVLAISLAGLHAGSSGPAYSAPVLFNQANAAFQQGKVGEAVANYERARILAPADPDIAANLNWVREHSGLTTPTASWLDRATSWASPNTMALLGWLGLVLTGAGFIFALSFSQRRGAVYFTSAIGIVLLAVSALSAITAWQKCHEAVVIAPDTTARISPVTNGEISFKLRPGETVSITGRYHDFTLVQNSAGHSGWVAQSEITPLVPVD